MSHSQFPPAAPPLPPKLSTQFAIPPPVKFQIDECLWALSHPDLQKACFLARICTTTAPRNCQFHRIDAILQEGPTCGLTALSMLLGGIPTPHELLVAAKDKRYTRNGEMFSARDLFELTCAHLHLAVSQAETITKTDTATTTMLAKECLRNVAAAVECRLHEGRLNCAKVKDCLLAGACLFVPYDPDFNHAPCLRRGHKAHWALIVGYLISDANEFYVLARHGKTKNLAVWTLEALSESNANLLEFAQPKAHPDCDFLLPPGGIGGDFGLRERAIIVEGLSQEMRVTVRGC